MLPDALEVLMFLKLAIPIFRGNPCESTESDLLIGISARTVQTGKHASSVRTISNASVQFFVPENPHLIDVKSEGSKPWQRS
jgi:hypothetical protein